MIYMKKIVFILMIVFISNTIFAQAGRVRISFAGFHCIRETADDILHLDGKMDEVFFNFSFTMADQNGGTKFKYQKRTQTYGDANGIFTNRISAGSALDLFGNLKGGIREGDSYSCNDIIGEYDMAAGDILSVIPTIWEWDPGPDNFNAYIGDLENSMSNINRLSPATSRAITSASFGLASIIASGGALAIPAFAAIMLRGASRVGTRPIGMTTDEKFVPNVMLLNAQALQNSMNRNFGYGMGVIPVQYNEEALGNTGCHGNYMILIKVEFFPTQSTTTNTSSTSKTTTSTLPVPVGAIKKTMGRTIPTMTNSGNFSITGTWTGSWGYGENSTTNNWLYQFNNDGTMKVLSPDGVTQANGNYTFINNVLSVTYNYTGGGAYSISGTYDANTGTLTGTWGRNYSTTDGGKWVLHK